MEIGDNMKKEVERGAQEKLELEQNVQAFIRSVEQHEAYFAKETTDEEEFKRLQATKQPLLLSASQSVYPESRKLAEQ